MPSSNRGYSPTQCYKKTLSFVFEISSSALGMSYYLLQAWSMPECHNDLLNSGLLSHSFVGIRPAKLYRFQAKMNEKQAARKKLSREKQRSRVSKNKSVAKRMPPSTQVRPLRRHLRSINSTSSTPGKPQNARGYDFFQDIPSGYSLRTKIRLKLANSTAGNRWSILQTLLSFATCVIFVISTYEDIDWDRAVEAVLLWFFLADYVLRFYCSENRLFYPLNVAAVIDLISMIPSAMDLIHLSSERNEAPVYQFMRFARILRVVRIIRSLKVVGHGGISAVQKQAILISLTVVSIVFVSAGFIYTVEKVNRDSNADQLTFGEAMYFIVVTISTVGYGDISPLTDYGRACTAIMIILSLVIVPMELNKLTELIALQSKFKTSYQPDFKNPHVLVVGHVSCASALKAFFMEFYHPDRAGNAKEGENGDTSRTPSIIMASARPTEEIKSLLANPILQNRVRYIQGSIMNEDDLIRVGVDTAKACFLLTDKSAPNSMQADAETLIRSMILENYNSGELGYLPLDSEASAVKRMLVDLRMFSEILNSTNQSYISKANADHVICIEEMLLAVLAKSCTCPGFSTLFGNLFRTTSIPEEEKQLWMTEYLDGCGIELYATSLPSLFYGKSFIQATEVVYEVFEGRAIVLGAEDGGRSYDDEVPLYVNPGVNYNITSTTIFYVLCESKEMSDDIANPESYIEWLHEGNKMPEIIAEAPKAVKQLRQEILREEETIVVNEHRELDRRGISGHIILHAELQDLDIESFLKPLRPRHGSPSDAHFYPILILSSSSKGLHAALPILKKYEGVYVMLEEENDYEENFLRAGIFTAACLVLLPNKSHIVEMDGEGLDSATIFRYLTVQNIIKNNPDIMDKRFVVFVEMTSTSTMQVMNTTLFRRLRSTKKKQREVSMVGTKLLSALDSSVAVSALSGTESTPMTSTRRLSLQASASISKIHQGIGETIHEIQSQRTLRENRQKQMLKMKEHQLRRDNSIGIVKYTLLPFFAAGYGFSSDIFDSLLCQSFFTVAVIRFARQLLSLRGDSEHDDFREHACSSLYQIRVPAQFVNGTYGNVFRFLVRHRETIPIGLYRNTNQQGQLPYVYTVPQLDTTLKDDDFIFVLSPPHTEIATTGNVGDCAFPTAEDNQVEKILLQLEKPNLPPAVPNINELLG